MDDMELEDDAIEPSGVTPEVSAVDAVSDAVAALAVTDAAVDAAVDAVADVRPEQEAVGPVADETPAAAIEPPASPAAAPHGAGSWFKFALLLTFIAFSLTAVVGDWVALAYVPRGVTLLGRDVGNLSAPALRAAIERHVVTPAMQPLTVMGDGKSWELDPTGIVSIDVDAMVSQAYAPAHRATIWSRLWSRVTGAPLRAEVKPVYSVASDPLARWVADTAATVERAPVDATRTVVKYSVKIKPEVMGAAVDETNAVETISSALTAQEALTPASRTVTLPIDFTTPKVTKAKFKKAIVVSLSKCKIYLYDGAKLIKTYPCAPGQPAWPTPEGDFVIERKLANAPWINPGSSWASGMPRSIPGGPYNPMGDRKIGINYPGIFMHGIPPSEYSSIGTHASHGCMRMMPSAVHDLYPRVHVGDPVYIRD